jgi:hypothetical protein
MLKTEFFAHVPALLSVFAVISPALVAGQNAPPPVLYAGAVTEASESQVPSPELSSRDKPHAAPDPSVHSVAVVRTAPRPKLPDFNRNIYYKNKLEFSLETGWLPNNIPFVFDFIVGSKYNSWPLHYTLVPNIASVRWQLDNIWGWKLFRGNTDFSFSGSYTAIPRGAETRYFAFDYGIRRNFIPPRWRVVPYVEGRGGIGNINAKGPYGVAYAQGQDMTFTLMVGSGARYSFGPRYAVSGGMTYMHVSNFYLSEPRYEDIGINVYGAIVGVYMRLGKPKPDALQ